MVLLFMVITSWHMDLQLSTYLETRFNGSVIMDKQYSIRMSYLTMSTRNLETSNTLATGLPIMLNPIMPKE